MISLLGKVKEKLLKNKLSTDIAWTLISFFTLAISGIIINIAITVFRDAAELGIFNQAYAVYIIISQFAVWGVHQSVLRHSAWFMRMPGKRERMLFSAGVIALVSGLFFALLMIIIAPSITYVFESAETGLAIQYAALGLILFPLNKVLLAYLNGIREIKAFSMFQSMRYFIVMLFVSFIAISNLSIGHSTLAFFLAEGVTTLGLMIFFWRRQYYIRPIFSNQWVIRHFKFGAKSLAGGIFSEVNSRVDIILIGIFLSDRETGIYSFAAMLVDGIYHILAMVRINFNPILVAVVRDRDWMQAHNLRSKAGKIIWPVVFMLSIFIVLAYLILATWWIPDKGLLEGLPSLLILLCGLNMICFLVPFDNLMIVSGHPIYQAIQQISAVAANFIVAIMLLPFLGIEGIALGTASSYFVGIALLSVFTSRLFCWNLISNKPLTSGERKNKYVWNFRSRCPAAGISLTNRG
jgi:O-antigen/teichoic acid export membrane protein